MHRDVHLPPFALALVDEAQARREERDNGRRPVLGRLKGRGRPWLVVILEKARQMILEVETGM